MLFRSRTIHERGYPEGSWDALNQELTREGSPLLTDHFLESIKAEASPHEAVIFSDARSDSGFDYGPIQQHGATIHAKPGRFLAWQSEDGAWHYAQTVTIPPRPFMMFREGEDEARIEYTAMLFLQGGLPAVMHAEHD